MAGPESLPMYGELAPWWPVISPPCEYEAEAAFLAEVLHGLDLPGDELLELGSGGGHNASHLSAHFAMTLVDLSEPMLEVSRALNPGCEHLRGDMRTVRLGRTFDGVLIHDALDYLTSEADLAATMTTAWVHLRPGGAVLLVPDHTAETFVPVTGFGGGDADDGRSARFLEWTTDPDPDDHLATSDYVFVLREPGRPDRIVTDRHTFGVFPRRTWLDALRAAGFDASALMERTDEPRAARELFVGRRPR